MRLMIEVFPAPVAPTIATLSPAAIVKSTSRSTQSPSLYAKLTLSKRTSPRTCASSRGCGGSTIVAGVSSSRNTRSDDAIAACMMLYFSDRSRIGRKNCSRSCQKASSVPIVIAPPRIQYEPAMNSAPALHHVRERVDVVRDPRHEPADRIPVEEAERQVLQVPEKGEPEVVHRLLADPRGEHALPVTEERGGDEHEEVDRAEEPEARE